MSKRILMVEHQKDDRQIGLRTPGKLIFPEVFESVRSQGRVADRGHDRSVAEIGLDGASVVAVVGELEPAGMPQHVGMHEEREFRSHARPGNHALISGYGQRRVTLRDKDVWGRWGFAQELDAARGFPAPISDARWHPRSWPCVHASAQWRGRCRPSAASPAPRPSARGGKRPREPWRPDAQSDSAWRPR